jgi:prophage regulatory protein
MRLLEFDQLKPEKGVPYCRDHLRRLVNNGRFPRPVNVSARRIAWLETDVDAWIQSKLHARDAKPE